MSRDPDAENVNDYVLVNVGGNRDGERVEALSARPEGQDAGASAGLFHHQLAVRGDGYVCCPGGGPATAGSRYEGPGRPVRRMAIPVSASKMARRAFIVVV